MEPPSPTGLRVLRGFIVLGTLCEKPFLRTREHHQRPNPRKTPHTVKQHRSPAVRATTQRSAPTEDGGGVLARLPDLLGCTSDGASREEALTTVQDAIGAWTEAARDLGHKGPAASTKNPMHRDNRPRPPGHPTPWPNGPGPPIFAATPLREGPTA